MPRRRASQCNGSSSGPPKGMRRWCIAWAAVATKSTLTVAIVFLHVGDSFWPDSRPLSMTLCLPSGWQIKNLSMNLHWEGPYRRSRSEAVSSSLQILFFCSSWVMLKMTSAFLGGGDRRRRCKSTAPADQVVMPALSDWWICWNTPHGSTLPTLG